MKSNPLLLCDFYKLDHPNMYPETLKYVTAYFRARTSRIPDIDYVVVFGVQYFIKKWIKEYFNNNFFNLTDEEYMKMCDEAVNIVSTQIPESKFDLEPWNKLRALGYLPLKISSFDEGAIVKIGIPFIEIKNTEPGFAWLVNYFETLLSTEIWYPITVATLAYDIRKSTQKFFDETCDNGESLKTTTSDFSMRGQDSFESGIVGASAFLTSFDKSSNVHTNLWLKEYYNANLNDPVGLGSISTEHSVMGMKPQVAEINLIRKLITEKYSTGKISIVSDNWDFWELMKKLPELKDDIMKRNGKVLIRPDSGYSLTTICGTSPGNDFSSLNHAFTELYGGYYHKFTVEGKEYSCYINDDGTPQNLNLFVVKVLKILD